MLLKKCYSSAWRYCMTKIFVFLIGIVSFASSISQAATFGKICTAARRMPGDTYSYYFYTVNPNVSFETVCQRVYDTAIAKSGTEPTDYAQDFFQVDGYNRATAECINGTWEATNYGPQAIIDVNVLRQQGGGLGCLIRIQGSDWR